MEQMKNEIEFGWDDTISKENQFVLLPEGEYDFTVINFARGRFAGSDKIPPCNKAELTLGILYNGETVEVLVNLLLTSKFEWKLSEFFLSIGLKKEGEPLKMNWNEVPGARGICFINTYKNNGNEYNNVKRFLLKPKVFTSQF